MQFGLICFRAMLSVYETWALNEKSCIRSCGREPKSFRTPLSLITLQVAFIFRYVIHLSSNEKLNVLSKNLLIPHI